MCTSRVTSFSYVDIQRVGGSVQKQNRACQRVERKFIRPRWGGGEIRSCSWNKSANSESEIPQLYLFRRAAGLFEFQRRARLVSSCRVASIHIVEDDLLSREGSSAGIRNSNQTLRSSRRERDVAGGEARIGKGGQKVERKNDF